MRMRLLGVNVQEKSSSYLVDEAKGSMIMYTSVATLLFTVNHGGILVARALVSATWYL